MLILIGSFLVLLILGLPVALAMAVSSLLYMLLTGTAPDVVLAQRMIAGVESFPLLAVPFFILAGNLMNIAGVTGRIYSFAVALVGWMKGGLGQVNIIGSVVFSARDAVDMPAPGETRPARFATVLRDPSWHWIYAPITRAFVFVTERLNVLQFLTIRRYLVLMFVALVVLLIVTVVAL